MEEKEIDWEQRRYELAKAAMQGFCSNPHQQIMDADSIWWQNGVLVLLIH